MAQYPRNQAQDFGCCTCSAAESNDYYDDTDENATMPAKPFLNSKINNKPLILDSATNKWRMISEFKILNGHTEQLAISIEDINVDSCPYVLPTLTSAPFFSQEKIILNDDTRLQGFFSCLQEVHFRAAQSEYYLRIKKLGQRHEKTLLIPMYAELFDWLANDTLHALEGSVHTRSINFGASIAYSEIDFELSKENRVRIVVEVKDAKDPRSKNIEAQLAGSFLAIAQSQLHLDVEEYTIYGITIIDYNFRFYETCISKKYLKEIGNASEPTEKLLIKSWIVEEQSSFSLLQPADRKKIIQLFKFMS